MLSLIIGLLNLSALLTRLQPHLHEAVKWLKACGRDSIAMESTGAYWISVFQILERYGFNESIDFETWKLTPDINGDGNDIDL